MHLGTPACRLSGHITRAPIILFNSKMYKEYKHQQIFSVGGLVIPDDSLVTTDTAITPLPLKTVSGRVMEPQYIQTNPKFHHKVTSFECMKIDQNYAQLTCFRHKLSCTPK